MLSAGACAARRSTTQLESRERAPHLAVFSRSATPCPALTPAGSPAGAAPTGGRQRRRWAAGIGPDSRGKRARDRVSAPALPRIRRLIALANRVCDARLSFASHRWYAASQGWWRVQRLVGDEAARTTGPRPLRPVLSAWALGRERQPAPRRSGGWEGTVANPMVAEARRGGKRAASGRLRAICTNGGGYWWLWWGRDLGGAVKGAGGRPEWHGGQRSAVLGERRAGAGAGESCF